MRVERGMEKGVMFGNVWAEKASKANNKMANSEDYLV